MSARLAALVLLAGAARAVQEGVARPLTAPPDRRIELDFQHYYTSQELTTALQQLARAYPEFLTLESLATTPGKHDVWVLSASDSRDAPAGERPGVLVVGSLGSNDLQGAEMALYTVFEMMQNRSRDPAIARQLEQSVFHFVPCLDPDLRERAFAALEGGGEWLPPPVQLERNFPVGWRPNAGGGPYPLSQVESRALAEFLMAHPSIAVVQVYGGGRGTPPAGTPEPEDAATYARLCSLAAEGATRGERQPLHSVFTCGVGGGLLEFASTQLGAFAFCVEVGSGFPSDAEFGMPRPSELTVIGQRASRTTIALAAALPRLTLSEPSVQRLKSDQWQVELVVANEGQLPTCSQIGYAHRAVAAPRLVVGGAQLVVAMLGTGSDGVYRPLDHATDSLPLTQLAAGERVAVRLIVSGQPSTHLTLELASARSGADWAQVSLE